MRVFTALALLVVYTSASVSVPQCGLENQQRFQINGAAIEKYQGFYAATSADLQDVISPLVQKHSASDLPSVAAGWIEVAGSNNAYLVASFFKVAVAGWVVQGPFAGTGLHSSNPGTSVQFVQSSGGAPIGALITVAADLPAYTGWVALSFALSGNGTVPANPDVFLELKATTGASFQRFVLNNDGDSTLTGSALNAPTLANITVGPIIFLGDDNNIDKRDGAFAVNQWTPCPTGCVDANNEACTVYTADDGCASVTAPSGESTCVSLKFTTSGTSC